MNLAMHAAAILADRPDRLISVKDLARRLNASEATLSKAMQRLVRENLVHSSRGPAGGFRLARPAADITLKEIVEAVDGPLSTPACLFGAKLCGRKECMLGGTVEKAHRLLEEKLAGTTLDQVTIPLTVALDGSRRAACKRKEKEG